MKIILSRKGFDSVNGGIASPILNDKTLLSLPIPSMDDVSYTELYYNNKSYYDIIRDLKPSFSNFSCHLDPDIYSTITVRPENWCSCFGQCDSSLSHLNGHNVSVGDIFLFFGWFRQTEESPSGQLRFAKNAPDLHVIFGYMQIGKIITDYDELKKYQWHPHVSSEYTNKKLNAIYVASDYLLDTKLPGFGTFKYSQDLVLTQNGMTRSKWKLPDCLIGKSISYHNSSHIHPTYFKSVDRGQEFVIDEVDDAIINWIKELVTKNSKEAVM